jgi:hypothetical protein
MATAVVDLDMYRTSASRPFLRQLKDYLYPDLELDLNHHPGQSTPGKKGYAVDDVPCATIAQQGYARKCSNLQPTVTNTDARQGRASKQYHASHAEAIAT